MSVLYRCLFPARLSESIQTLFTPVSAQSRWHSYTSKEGEHTWRGFVQPDVLRLTGGETLENALLHLSMIKLHETNRLNGTGLLRAVTVTPAVSFSQHKHWLRLWVGTSPCCCRHNGLGLFSSSSKCLPVMLKSSIMTHAISRHSEDGDVQGNQLCSAENRRYYSESHICFAISRTSRHSIKIFPHVIALFWVCQGFCARTLQTNVEINLKNA